MESLGVLIAFRDGKRLWRWELPKLSEEVQ